MKAKNVFVISILLALSLTNTACSHGELTPGGRRFLTILSAGFQGFGQGMQQQQQASYQPVQHCSINSAGYPGAYNVTNCY